MSCIVSSRMGTSAYGNSVKRCLLAKPCIFSLVVAVTDAGRCSSEKLLCLLLLGEKKEKVALGKSSVFAIISVVIAAVKTAKPEQLWSHCSLPFLKQ